MFASRATLVLTCTLAAGGCAYANYPDITPQPVPIVSPPAEEAEYWQRAAELSLAIQGLSEEVDPGEARRVAQMAVFRTMSLANEYGILFRPVLHNVMVNTGLRKRGLCKHWTVDVLNELRALDLQTLDLYWAVANPGSNWPLEHSTPVVTADGGAFDNGIVLDGWRYAGDIYWGSVTEDEKYVWTMLIDQELIENHWDDILGRHN